jgi:hypothetical protein
MTKKIPTSAGIPCDLNFSYTVRLAKEFPQSFIFFKHSIKSLGQLLPSDQRWNDLPEYSGLAPNSSA